MDLDGARGKGDLRDRDSGVDVFMVVEARREDGVAHRSCVDGINKKDRV